MLACRETGMDTSSKLKFPQPLFNSFLLLGLLIIFPSSLLFAQQQASYEVQREQAAGLMEARDYADALPLLKKLADANRPDAAIMYALGVASLMNAVETQDANIRRQLL